MKCEKCENEAVFHYQRAINGEKTEMHLCADCAKAAGFGEMLSFHPRTMLEPFGSLMGSFFREPFGSLTDGFLRDPFGSLTDGFFRDPFGSFFGKQLEAPKESAPDVSVKIGEAEKSTESPEAGRHNIPEDAGEEFRKKRELFALRHQMHTAVRAEDFEMAAELRDKIRALEK